MEAQRGEAIHSISQSQNLNPGLSNFQVFSLPMLLLSDLVSVKQQTGTYGLSSPVLLRERQVTI